MPVGMFEQGQLHGKAQTVMGASSRTDPSRWPPTLTRQAIFLRRMALSRSNVAYRFIQSLADVPQTRVWPG